jgi:hypothetical protein
MRIAAKTSSPTPSEISANTTPARRVETAPKSMPKKRPAVAPAIGTSGIGIGSPPLIARMRWMLAYPPSPKYTAWPNDSSPVWPSSRLYDSANTAAIPICESSERPKLPSSPGTCGRTIRSRAATTQTFWRAAQRRAPELAAAAVFAVSALMSRAYRAGRAAGR